MGEGHQGRRSLRELIPRRDFLIAYYCASAQIAFWDDALAKTTDSAEWKKNLEDGDITQQFMRSREFADFLEREYATTRAVMAELGMVK